MLHRNGVAGIIAIQNAYISISIAQKLELNQLINLTNFLFVRTLNKFNNILFLFFYFLWCVSVIENFLTVLYLLQKSKEKKNLLPFTY